MSTKEHREKPTYRAKNITVQFYTELGYWQWGFIINTNLINFAYMKLKKVENKILFHRVAPTIVSKFNWAQCIMGILGNRISSVLSLAAISYEPHIEVFHIFRPFHNTWTSSI